MKKFAKIIELLALIILLFVLAGLAFVFVQSKPVSTNPDTQKVRIEIPYGMSVPKVASTLKENNLIKNEKLFYIFARVPQLRKIFYSNDDNSISFVLKSGIYYISPSMSIAQIQNLLSSGQQEFIKVSIPEGLTISAIANLLDENRICTKADFIDSCHNSNILTEFSIPSTAESIEGYLFPETYFLNIEMNSDEVVRLMVNTFFEKIKSVPGLSEKTPEELHGIVILSSIVEREYRVEDEAPLIASVFKNRIRQNIGLYSCATIVYILTEIEGRPHPDKILIEDTKIDNPYNTYKWAGLTPGPISNPGLVSLNACTNTPKTDYYFFQVVNPEEGRHVFTRTFDEHKLNHVYTKK